VRRQLEVAFAVIALAMSATSPARADTSTTRHLLAGVHAFKEGHYEDALVELRVVARSPDAPADLAFYLGPTLYKLGRYREALAVFVSSTATSDALTDFYLGETYYQLRLYRKARAVFDGLRARGLGPVLDAAVARYIAMVDALYVRAPTPATIDYYVELGTELAKAPDQALVAAEVYDEARQVEALAATPHRHDEIVAALGAAWNAAGRARAVIDVLARDPALSADGRWQLARAYVVTGDLDRARVLLDGLVHDGGPHAKDAAALRAELPR